VHRKTPWNITAFAKLAAGFWGTVSYRFWLVGSGFRSLITPMDSCGEKLHLTIFKDCTKFGSFWPSEKNRSSMKLSKQTIRLV
jgi:hypothetical protein